MSLNATTAVKVVSLAGIQNSEEAKGAAVEWLTRELNAHTIIRNGGCQAGHHIVTADGREQVFSHYAAGTFEGANTYLRHMVIDPVALFREAVELEDNGVVDPFNIISIDGENTTITPFHGALSRFKEILRSEKKGTVGMGVGDAVKDALLGKTTIRAKDFRANETELKNKVEYIRQLKIQQAIDLIVAMGIEELPEDAYEEMKTLHNADLVSLTVQSFKYLADLVDITDEDQFDQLMNQPGNIVTEPSHGALLHPFAFVPHTTQVDPTSKELIEELKQKNTKKVIRIGVGRCYMTRHGAGPLVSFDRTMTDTIHETHNAANKRANEWLGEFKIGQYDLIATRYGLDLAGGKTAFDGFMMSYLDVLSNYPKWGVVEAYTFDGDDTDLTEYFEMKDDLVIGIKLHSDTRDEAHYQHQARLTELLRKCSPVVTYLSPTENKSLEEVFIEYVEEKTGVPIIAVSRGPKAEDREKRASWEKVFGTSIEKEVTKSSIFMPFSLDLYYTGQEKTHLSKKIDHNPKLRAEAKQRRELNEIVSTLFAKIPHPNMNVGQALEKGLISENELTAFYEQLTAFIQADKNHARIILYLPSQLLPHIKLAENNRTTQKFAEVYKNAWYQLLHESEPRASYVDGDLLEEGMGAPPRIRKVGHLLPDLLESGVIDLSEIMSLFEVTHQSELHESLMAGLLVARERNLVSDEEWKIFQMKILPNVLGDIYQKNTLNSSQPVEISPERKDWENQVKSEAILETEANSQLLRVQSGETTITRVFQLDSLVGIKVIMYMGEQLAKTDKKKAQAFAQEQLAVLEAHWREKAPGAANIILTLLSHWSKLAIVNSDQLDTFEIQIPDLAAPFPLDLDKEVNSEMAYAVEASKKIEGHPKLSQYLFPIIVAVGSRVKGQAGPDTDFDAGIVFKPTTPWEMRSEILEIIRQDIPELSRIHKPLEFWLSQNDTGYGIKATPTDIETVVTPVQIHFFLNGIWFSQTPEFQKISEDILNKYLDTSRFLDQKDEVRRQLLRQLELDMLQYRLMHKGYRRFYPSYKADGTESSKMIDWESDYWDPQYRRIATQLFLSRVFLPDLSS